MSDEYDKMEEMARQSSSSQSKSSSRMEEELAKEKDHRREDRYIYFVLLVCIFDVWAFNSAKTWTVPIVIGVIELIPLVILAQRMGIEEIQYWLDRAMKMVQPQDHFSDEDTSSKKKETKGEANSD